MRVRLVSMGCAGLVAAAALLAPAGSSADEFTTTYTVGGVSPAVPGAGDCVPGRVFLRQGRLGKGAQESNDDVVLLSPQQVITSWATRANGDPGQRAAVVNLINRTGIYKVDGVSPVENLRPNVVNRFSVRVPIHPPGSLGYFVPAGVPGPAACRYQSSDNGATLSGASSGQQGSALEGVDTFRVPANLNLETTIEADRDRDGYGDATQDGCAADAATHGPCPLKFRARVSRLSLQFKKFKAARSGAAISRFVPTGTVVSFSVSLPSKVKFTVQKKAGRRWKSVKGSVTKKVGAGGSYNVQFRGRIGGKALTPGKYRLTATAADARTPKQFGPPRRQAFQIVR